MVSCSYFSSSVICYSGCASTLELIGFLIDFYGDFDFSLPLSDHVYRFLASLLSYFLTFYPAPNASLVLTGFSFEAGGNPAKESFSLATTVDSSIFEPAPFFTEAGAICSYFVYYIGTGTPLSNFYCNFLLSLLILSAFFSLFSSPSLNPLTLASSAAILLSFL